MMKTRKYFLPLYFAAAYFFEELVLKFSTDKTGDGGNLCYMLLFAAGYGLLAWLLSEAVPKRFPRLRIAAGALLLLLPAILFSVEFFVYRAFKVFYDLNTVTAGAGGVVGEFTGDIVRLVFCADGAGHILLFSLPCLLYLILARCFPAMVRGAQLPLRTGFVTACLVYIALGLGALVLKQDAVLGPAYDEEYNFQKAVSNFGLMTALRLDVSRSLFPERSDGSFSDTSVIAELLEGETEEVGSPEGEAEDPGETGEAADAASGKETEGGENAAGEAEKPVIYGRNILDIDFEALAAQPGTGSALAELDRYAAQQPGTKQNPYTGLFAGKNLIFITAEAFSGHVIDPEKTPTLYRLAEKGIRFTNYYQPASAGTTGGEYSNVFGMLPSAGGKSFKMTATRTNYMTMGWQLNRLGYFGKAYHNNTATYYDRTTTHNALGYSEGFMGLGTGMEAYVQRQWPESDLEMINGTMDEYLSHQPFNIYYMSVSGHGVYSYAENNMSKKNWERTEYYTGSEPVRAYYAANLELEDALTALVGRLEEEGIADDTVIVIGADHFPYGLDHDAALGNMPYLSELYGENVRDLLVRDRNRLIIWSGCLEKEEPITIDVPVSSIDILPTLLNLFGVDYDSRILPGRDVFSNAIPLVYELSYDWVTDRGRYYSGSGKFEPADPESTVSKEYIEAVKILVRNKIRFSEGVLKNNYFEHVLGNYPGYAVSEAEDPEEPTSAEPETEPETEPQGP